MLDIAVEDASDEVDEDVVTIIVELFSFVSTLSYMDL